MESAINPFHFTVDTELVNRYNRPGPRYTSYPTAPHFNESYDAEQYRADLDAAGRGPDSRDLSLYVHIPFCRSLCYYCGCHMMVTHRPEKVETYLRYVEKEMDLVSRLTNGRKAHQIHWGGGTPTFLDAGQIRALMQLFTDRFDVLPDAEISLEADPRGLTIDRLETARSVGFNRISFGVQDFEPDVQQAIGRIQPEDLVAETVDHCRRLQFDGISFDLIYGLPFQTLESFDRTLHKVIRLGPDRISLFSYAHLPWLKKHQKLIIPSTLPDPETKLSIFSHAIDTLTRLGGYRYIGMDHFARPGDSLCRAQDEGTLYRNFQGYSTHAGSDLLAFGISGISQLESSYAQNVKELPSYYRALDEARLPIQRGLRLNSDDQLRRHVITRLMCDFSIDKRQVENRFGIEFDTYFADAVQGLTALESDGLVVNTPDFVNTTGTGRLLIRIIAMEFDAYLAGTADRPAPRFSQTV